MAHHPHRTLLTAIAMLTLALSPAPLHAQATAPAAGLDAAKAQIGARMVLAKQLIAAGKLEDFERIDKTPDEWNAKLKADPKAMEKQLAKDKADPTTAKKYPDWVRTLLASPDAIAKLSDDGATFSIQPAHYPGSVWIVFKKVDGAWYRSESETDKAMHSTDRP